MSNQKRILIIGAGPVGLTLAIILGLNGISCRIVDKRKHSSELLRAIAISKATENIFTYIGVIKAIREKALSVPSMVINHYSGWNFHFDYMDFNVGDSSYLHIYQPEIEEILLRRLAELSVDVEREVELVDIKNTDDSLNAMLRLKDGSIEESEYEYLIGCDGANSTVRKLCKIELIEELYNSGFILADAKVDGLFYHQFTRWYVNSNGYLAIIPAPDGRVRIIFSSRKIEDINLTVDVLNKHIKEMCDAKIVVNEIVWQAKSLFRHAIASIGNKGRVFLAGDAYHIFSPIGGVNMNFGLQDAESLSWRIVQVLKNRGASDILDEYEVERRVEINKVLSYTKLLSQLMINAEKYKKMWKFFLAKLQDEKFRKSFLLLLAGAMDDSIYKLRISGDKYLGNAIVSFPKNYILFLPKKFHSKKIDLFSDMLEIKFFDDPNIAYFTAPHGRIEFQEELSGVFSLRKFLKKVNLYLDTYHG
jgi:2-polyprenyl-6-methoxyphenol hydroxylase-like FAD-dependent oxidoreductase